MSASDNEQKRINAEDWIHRLEASELPPLSPEAQDLAGELLQHSQAIQPDARFAKELGERLKLQIPLEAKPSRWNSFRAGLRTALSIMGRISYGAAALALLVGVIWLAMRALPDPNRPPAASLLTASAPAAPPNPSSTPAGSPRPDELPVVIASEEPGYEGAQPTTTTKREGPIETPLPTPTKTMVPCNQAAFFQDLTVPDGSDFIPGAIIQKLWRLQNAGSCTWTAQYRLAFAGGERMDGQAQPLPRVVAPGEVVDVRVDFIAPEEPGQHQSQWMLRDSEGELFGLGSAASVPFFADIQVTKASHGAIYDFAANFCAAQWSNATGALRCPGKEIDGVGYVFYEENPVLETGIHEDQPALITVPQQVRDGMIRGIYPAFEVQEGDRFIADVGCLDGNSNCQVMFQVGYRIAGVDAPVKKLDEWTETYDGSKTRVDIGLSALVGKKVEFILTVYSDRGSNEDQAFWLAPQIYR